MQSHNKDLYIKCACGNKEKKRVEKLEKDNMPDIKGLKSVTYGMCRKCNQLSISILGDVSEDDTNMLIQNFERIFHESRFRSVKPQSFKIGAS